jgi:hypothetical protein
MIDPDKIISEVALHHGVALGKDDPVMILNTLNELLFEDNVKTMKACHESFIKKFRAELETSSKAWTEEARRRAQQAIELAIEASQAVAICETRNELEPLAAIVKKEMEAIHTAQRQLTWMIAVLALLCLGLMGTVVFLWVR